MISSEGLGWAPAAATFLTGAAFLAAGAAFLAAGAAFLAVFFAGALDAEAAGVARTGFGGILGALGRCGTSARPGRWAIVTGPAAPVGRFAPCSARTSVPGRVWGVDAA